jgi:hypothetical protein
MDKQLFKELLEQVAVIKELKPTKSPTHNRFATEIVIEVDEDGEEYEVEREITENPTLGFELTKLKEVNRLCELGCGEVIANQHIAHQLHQKPERHWRTKCVTCGCWVSPDGGGFIESGTMISAAYIHHFKQKK